jgi:ligand-binding sensor domain-containing protein
LVNLRAFFLIFLLFFAQNVLVFGQTSLFSVYSLAEGLPQSQVISACSDARGYCWFGTKSGGLAKFDGQKMELFSTSDGLPSNQIQTIYQSSDGLIWVGTDHGFGFFKLNQPFKKCAFSDGQKRSVTAFFKSKNGTFWVGTTNGLFQLNGRNGLFEPFISELSVEKAVIFNFFETKFGLWIGTNLGACRVDKTIRWLKKKDGLPTNSVRDFAQIHPDSSLLMAIYGGGLAAFDEKNWTISAIQNNDNNRWATCIFLHADGKIWLGTDTKGVAVGTKNDEKWSNLTEKEGLPSNNIQKIIRDAWQIPWICTSGGGIAKSSSQTFASVRSFNRQNDNRVYALLEGRAETFWAAAGTAALTNFDKKNNLVGSLEDSILASFKVKSLLLDSKNRVWAGSEGGGIVVFDTSGKRYFSEKNGLPSNWIRSIIEDKSGSIWVATAQNGLARIHFFDGNSIVEKVSFGEKTGNILLSSLKLDAQNRVWFSTKKGEVGYFEKNKIIQIFNQINAIPPIEIRSIAFDSQYNCWIGTAGEGVFWANLNAKSIEFKPLKFSENTPLRNIYLLHFDQQNQLWAGTEQGVARMKLDEKNQVKSIDFFGKNDGFSGIETCQNSVLETQTGQIYFGTMNGIMQFLPNKTYNIESKPIIYIEKVTIDYQSIENTIFAKYWSPLGKIADGFALPWSKNDLGFVFQSVDLLHPNRPQFRWKLNKDAADWSPISTSNSINFADLSPDNYEFQVQSTSDGVHFSDVAVVKFSILQPFWQSIWFKIGSILGCFGLFWAWTKHRERRLKQKEAALRADLELKNQLLTLEQKALQLQMNPHFIFNTLNSIQALVSAQDFQIARTEINQFAALMRGILNNARKTKITLAEEIFTLDKYLKIEQFCHKQSFDYQIVTPQNFDLEEIEIPPMLLQPFVENGLLHGILPLEKRGYLSIIFSIKKEILNCEISDNGIGRTRAAQLKIERKAGHQSVAMDVTKARLEALFTEKSVQPLEISDILNEKSEVCGTRVLVQIPILFNF